MAPPRRSGRRLARRDGRAHGVAATFRPVRRGCPPSAPAEHSDRSPIARKQGVPMSVNVVRSAPEHVATSDTGALDVHAHAMPLPLLQRLADRELAELDEVPTGIVRLDPRVSGVGPRAPLPLARSMYDVDVRLSEMDEVGVHRHAVSLPPFLFASTADDEHLATGVVTQGNDELATYVADAPDRLLGLGSVPLGWRGAADEARRALDELGMAGIAIGSRGG